MKLFYRAAKVTLLILALNAWFLTPSATAQTQTSTQTPTTSPQPKEITSDEGWHVGFTPYIWFAGMHGTVGILNREASVHASFADIFNYLNIGLMAAVEPRYNRIVMPVDFMWMKLSDERGLPFMPADSGTGATSIKAQLTQTILTPKIGYRFIDTKKAKVDALFGVRYWHLSTTFTLRPTQIANGLSQSASWVDGIGGGKIELGLTPKLSATILGDAGGGSARSDYEFAGLLGYQVSRKCVLLAGYRYLDVNYRPMGKFLFVNDVAMPGLVLGLTINVK